MIKNNLSIHRNPLQLAVAAAADDLFINRLIRVLKGKNGPFKIRIYKEIDMVIQSKKGKLSGDTIGLPAINCPDELSRINRYRESFLFMELLLLLPSREAQFIRKAYTLYPKQVLYRDMAVEIIASTIEKVVSITDPPIADPESFARTGRVKMTEKGKRNEKENCCKKNARQSRQPADRLSDVDSGLCSGP